MDIMLMYTFANFIDAKLYLNWYNSERMLMGDKTNLASIIRHEKTSYRSRDFKFNGKIHDEFIFWDFNYAFEPHRLFLPQKVKQYIDGEKMLEQQALSAIEFWKNNS